jgi:hypothetical protein
MLLASLCAIALPLRHAAAQDNAGVAALVRNQVIGELAGTTARTLVRGDRVFRNEKVATGDASALNVLFLDQTSLALGPNTSIVLDEMVYDPTAARGRVALSVATGVTRFVSGILPKADYEIRTPTLIIGVRGTSFDLFVRANGDSTLILRSGELIAHSRAQPLAAPMTLSTPGLAITGTNAGPPGPPGPVPGDAARALAGLPGAQFDLATGGRSPSAPTAAPVGARSYTGALSDIGKAQKCKSNGSHGQSGPGC